MPGEPSSTMEKTVYISLMVALIVATGSFAYLRLTEPPQINIRRMEKQARAQKDLALLERAVKGFHDRHGRYPPTLENLAPEFMETVPKDPWGRAYVWQKAGETWRIASYGKDGQPGKHPWYDLETLDTYVFLETR